jgi:amidase
VAANLVPLTFASETDGSITGPAQINAVVGIKPTPGLTSRSGVIPSSETYDTVGPIARTVADAVIGLNAIVDVDERDPLTSLPTVRREPDYSQYLSTKAALKGAKFGLPIKRCWEFVSNDQKAAALKVFEGMKEAGAEIIHVDYPCAEDRIALNGKWDWFVTSPLRLVLAFSRFLLISSPC